MDSRLNVALNIPIDGIANCVSEHPRAFRDICKLTYNMGEPWPGSGGGRQVNCEMTTTHSIHILPQRQALSSLRH
jgi:hypothetical protein